MKKLQESPVGGVPRTHELRQHTRRKLAGMAYVELTQDNGGILLNLSEGGFAIQSALVLSSREFPELRFQLPNMRGWLTGSGRVVWMSESKKEAGIQFLDLHEHARAQVRAWVSNDGLDESAAVQAGVQTYPSEVSGDARHSEPPMNGGKTTWETGRPGAQRPATERTVPNVGSARHTEAPPAQDDRNFRFNDYSMFAADANGDVTWLEPARPRRRWGSYVLFTILLAGLFFVLGAMIGRDNLNGWVSSVGGWNPIQGQAPSNAKPPAPPEEAQSRTRPGGDTTVSGAQSTGGEQPSGDSSQISPSGENAAATASAPSEQKAPEAAANQQAAAKEQPSSTSKGAAVQSGPPEVAPPVKGEGSSGSQNVSTLRGRSANSTKPAGTARRDTPDADVTEAGDSGRSILVNAPAPGSPPFFVNLPGEPVSASSSVAISARRSIQIPPRADGYGSERMIVGKLLAHSDPFYPLEARNKRIEGIVELHAVVGRSGQVLSVTPTSGPQVLVTAGIAALHEWRYEPTFINGDPVETHVDVTMVFRSR
jgi:outer membrane biosynthesis protein TonB